MKRLLLILIVSPLVVVAQKDYASKVNPFIGTGGHGHTYPGASAPFGAVQLSPDTRMADWDGSSGYHYSDSLIYGFSHTHLSGTGIPDYCDLLVMPFSGEPSWEKEAYRSTFSHATEKASPGYYEVMLDKQHIRAQLTATTRAGMHQYTFPKNVREGGVLIDLQHRDQVLDAYIEKVNDYEIRGYRRSKSWAQDQLIYFFMRFEQPITSFTIQGNTAAKAGGKNIKAVVKAALNKDNMFRCKTGLSAVSMEGAQKNLDAEMPSWDFHAIHKATRSAWNKELAKIDIEGGTKDQQAIFYTALYHAFLVPNIFQDVDGQYRGTDGKNHHATGFTNYSVFSLWDTYRAYHPLMTIINQKRTTDWIQTFLQQYKNGGMLPVWELAGNETFCMIGYHSVPVIVDAYQKGIRGFDAKLALEAMRSYAESERFGLAEYRRLGYIPNDKEHESVSKTLEYAYDDWCIAQFGKMLGDRGVYETYTKRAQYYKNIFDPQTGHMRGKIQSMWHNPFDPREINNFFTEGNSWQYSFAVPQDIKTLIALHGGQASFARKLKELFSANSQTTGRDQADVTGLIGQYAQGNEPSHHMAYLFNFVDTPSYTQAMVQTARDSFYRNAPDGLIGNEDCGQMSAWYIFSALGFYPVLPGSGEYVIGTPLFDKATIHLENGKKFVVRAKRLKPGDRYVVSAALNEKPLAKSYLLHDAIMKGGSLHFNLSFVPHAWGTKPQNHPHSSISDHQIVAVPYFKASRLRFRDSLHISIVAPNSTIEYEHDSVKGTSTGSRVSMVVRDNMTIRARAVSGFEKSATVTQSFYKLPHQYHITVNSKVHPLYTGGGNEMLIDGNMGDSNWRSGEWQSYFDTDFEAVIDMDTVKNLQYAAIHVLQDVSPWIIYPIEVVVYTSIDGVQYEEAGKKVNTIPTTEGNKGTMEMGVPVNRAARYVKIRAKNGGRLPAWHESAGQPSHLFIDEIIIR